MLGIRIKDILLGSIFWRLKDTVLLRIIGRQLINTYSKSKRGKLGERLALIYLRRKGYKLLGRNIKTPLGEIDLLFLQPKDIVVVVEVRVTKGIIEAFPRKKERKIRLLTEWLNEYILPKDKEYIIRGDLILIDAFSAHIEHLVDIL